MSSVTLLLLLAALVLLASCIQGQAPGDDHRLCTSSTADDGNRNPLFRNRPRYSANERPLMDSRDYADVLSNFIIFPAPWQRVDRDSNNSVGVLTEVYKFDFFRSTLILFFTSSGHIWEQIYVPVQ